MRDSFKTILIGGESARKAGFRIAEFDYLIGQPLSVSSFVNPSSSVHFQLINCGEKWVDVPIFETLEEAVQSDKKVNTVGIHFNAKHVLNWIQNVIKFPQIKNVVILAEDVPERDAREIALLAKKHNLNILGPSSLGMIVAGVSRIGELCGDFRNLQLCKLDQKGSVGIVSKSGTITGEMVWVVSQNSPGVSAVVQIGGDSFPATDFVHWLEYFAKDSQTKVVVLAGEVGGDLEERAASWYKAYLNGGANKSRDPSTRKLAQDDRNKFKLISVVSGKFLEKMPKGQKFGHAGAKQEESGLGSAEHKIKALREAGVEVVEFEELGKTLKKYV